MNKRPTSLTVIAWILIASALISAISTLVMMDNPIVVEMMNKNPMPVSLQYGLMIVGLLIMIVSGSAMLKGKSWARWLYVGWGVIGLLVGLITSPINASLLPSWIFLAVVTFFLFRPNVNTFFSQAKSSNDA